MTTASLDYIVKNFLLKKGYPLHWYMQFMVYASDCLRDITFDDLRVINTKILPVNQAINTAELPEDYQDYDPNSARQSSGFQSLTKEEMLAHNLADSDDEEEAKSQA